MWVFGCIILVSSAVSLHEDAILDVSLISKAKKLSISLGSPMVYMNQFACFEQNPRHEVQEKVGR